MKAVVIFNLGGPDSLGSLGPFLFNLFYDPAIIDLPNPFRFFLAKLISWNRKRTAVSIYQHLGGKSPILEETERQATALQEALGNQYKVLIAMRYWHPMIPEVLSQIKEMNPTEIILLPLYPQNSLSTTQSFFQAWDEAIREEDLNIPVLKIESYEGHESYIQANIDVIRKTIQKEKIPKNARYLFSAHGLPKKNIRKGDPYEEQIHRTVLGIISKMPEIKDHVICYQSKVGPLEWLGPSTEDEIKRAAADDVPVVIVPVSFVSENSETLYELDYQYKDYADQLGLKEYYRVPTVQDNQNYIECLRDLVMDQIDRIDTKAA